eukprot:SAG31_NODE_8775_length_1390_cov_0.707978_2_plen_82_part_00
MDWSIEYCSTEFAESVDRNIGFDFVILRSRRFTFRWSNFRCRSRSLAVIDFFSSLDLDMLSFDLVMLSVDFVMLEPFAPSF